MELAGTVHHGVIVVDNGQRLPAGTRVKIVVEVLHRQPTLAELLLTTAFWGGESGGPVCSG
jgi:hypothetical protein